MKPLVKNTKLIEVTKFDVQAKKGSLQIALKVKGKKKAKKQNNLIKAKFKKRNVT